MNDTTSLSVQDQEESSRKFTHFVESSSSSSTQTTIQQDAIAVCITHSRYLEENIRELLVNVKERQEKISKIHELMREINGLIDTEGNLNLKGHPEVQSFLKAVSEQFGIKINVNQTQYSTHQCNRLIEGLNNAAADLESQNRLEMQKIQHLTSDKEQSILIAKTVASTSHSTIRAMISGIGNR